MTRSRPSRDLEEILKDHIRTLATTLQPETILSYGTALNHFLAYLRIAFPKVRHLSQLRRDPHLLGWFRWLRCPMPLGENTLTSSAACSMIWLTTAIRCSLD